MIRLHMPSRYMFSMQFCGLLDGLQPEAAHCCSMLLSHGRVFHVPFQLHQCSLNELALWAIPQGIHDIIQSPYVSVMGALLLQPEFGEPQDAKEYLCPLTADRDKHIGDDLILQVCTLGLTYPYLLCISCLKTRILSIQCLGIRYHDEVTTASYLSFAFY